MTLCKNGHERRPETVDKLRRCVTCLKDYQTKYRVTMKKKTVIAGFQAKDKATTPIYFPEAILSKGKDTSWYERSRAQMKALASHKYAVKSVK